MGHEIFISYAHEDKLMADAICATLERNGLRCWIAPRDVPPGSWGAAIVEAIEASKALVMVFSCDSNKSPQVVREVERGVSKGLIVVPVRIQDVPLSKEMQYFISSQHWLDAITPPVERHFEEVAQKLKILLASTPGSGIAPDPTYHRPTPVLSARRGLLPALGAILLLGVATVILHPWSRNAKNAEPLSQSKVTQQTPPVERPSRPTRMERSGVNSPGAAIGREPTGPTLIPMPQKPILIEPLQDMTAREGTVIEIPAKVQGDGSLGYAWQFKPEGGDWTMLPDQTSPRLQLGQVRGADGGQYRLIATNGGGAITSAPVTLAVNLRQKPELLNAPANVETVEGSNVVFSVRAKGDAPLTFRWESNLGGSAWRTIPGATLATFTLNTVSTNQIGQYRVVVQNSAGAVTSTPPASLTVTARPPEKPVLVLNVISSRAVKAAIEIKQLHEALLKRLSADTRFTVIDGTASAGAYVLTLTCETFKDELGKGTFDRAAGTMNYKPTLHYSFNWTLTRDGQSPAFGSASDGVTTDISVDRKDSLVAAPERLKATRALRSDPAITRIIDKVLSDPKSLPPAP